MAVAKLLRCLCFSFSFLFLVVVESMRLRFFRMCIHEFPYITRDLEWINTLNSAMGEFSGFMGNTSVTIV